MKEARVTCKIEQIKLPDMGITLVRGQEVWFGEREARRSADLNHARKIGAIDLRWETRCRVSKPPAPPHFRKLRPGVRKQIEPSRPEPAKPAPAPAPSVDLDLIGKQVKAQVAAEMARQMGQLEGQMETMRTDIVSQVTAALSGQKGMDAEQMAAVLKATLEQVLPAHSAAVAAPAAKGHATVSSDAPMFIPEGIVKETKGKVKVQQATGSTGGLDDAAAALKALKRKKKDKTND